MAVPQSTTNPTPTTSNNHNDDDDNNNNSMIQSGLYETSHKKLKTGS